MTWKKLNNAHFGSSTTFGGVDIDKISKLFDGTLDIDEQDINSSTTIRSSKFKFRNPSDTYSYTVTPSAITADRTVTIPQLENDSEFLFANAPQTISNKILTNCTLTNATYTNLPSGVIGDPSIKRWGSYQPLGAGTTASTIGKLDGILSGHTPTANSVNLDYEQSVALTTSTVDDSTAGLFPNTSTNGPFRTAKAGRIRARFAASFQILSRAFIGLASFTSIPSITGAGGILYNDHSGVLVGLHQSNGVLGRYRVEFNDGTLGGSSAWISQNTTDLNFHTFEISWPDGGTPITIIFDESEITSFESPTQKLPSPSTNLYFWTLVQRQLGGSATRSIFIKGIWIETS